MKYNPLLNDWSAGLEGFSKAHPQSPEEDAQGPLEILFEIQEWFKNHRLSWRDYPTSRWSTRRAGWYQIISSLSSIPGRGQPECGSDSQICSWDELRHSCNRRLWFKYSLPDGK